MKRLFKILIPLGLVLTAGCVVAPLGPRGYYGPRVAVVAPAPVVVVRPYHYGWWLGVGRPCRPGAFRSSMCSHATAAARPRIVS